MIRKALNCVLPVVLSFLATACSPAPNQAVTRSEPILIEPNVAVGKIRAGMTVDQMIAEIGEPARRTAESLHYPALGLAVRPAEGTVQVVMCGDVMGLQGPYSKAFNGHTKQGIGLQSTREEVIAAFGKPTETEGFPGKIEVLKYAPQGLRLALEHGRVYHMIIWLRGSQPDQPKADPTITIDLNPSPGTR